MAGIIVVIGVIAIPGIPVGYSTPAAVFLGALTVFVMAGRRYRRQTEGFRTVESRQTAPEEQTGAEGTEAAGAAQVSGAALAPGQLN